MSVPPEDINEMLRRLNVTPISNAPISGPPVGGPVLTSPVSISPPALSPANPGFVGPPVSGAGSPPPSFGDKLLTGLNSPLGQFGANLLAQSGPSLVPQSLGSALGKAGLATSQNDIQRRLLESRIGINQRVGQPTAPEPPKAATDVGKTIQDFNNGIITEGQKDQKLAQLRGASARDKQTATAALRGEFRTDTKDVRASLNDLAKSEALIDEGNPLSLTAAFTAFVKSIDNSVVRPAELAAYNDALGFAKRLETEMKKLVGQGPLLPEVRAALKSSIAALRSQLEGLNNRTIDFYNGEAGKAELDAESVTGLPSSQGSSVANIDVSAENVDSEIAAVEKEIADLKRQLAEAGGGN